MRLTHIKLAGFKSFVEPSTIYVNSQLVAVIGPNGCGKSNVIDAVRWVLGEASAKQLRGENMQDVIFNGAVTRRPAPRASVELVFDNSDQTLQGAWGQYNEISIKRQLTRQGDSGYFINHQLVRRRDITDLFLGTGVGVRGYAVIEQGMISRIIEARPEELRVYIEEAAGVSKYKERRRETELRLKETNEHLQRLADLQAEWGRQVGKLQKQATAAAYYRELTDELAHHENLFHYIHWQRALTDADHASAEHAAAQLQLDSLIQTQQQLTERLQLLRDTEHQQQQHYHTLNQKHALLREQMVRLEEKIHAQQHQQQHIERERIALQNAWQSIEQERDLLISEKNAVLADVANREGQIVEWSLKVAENEAQLAQLEEVHHLASIHFQHQQDEFNQIKHEWAVKQQQLKHTEHHLTTIIARQNQLKNEQATLNLPTNEEWMLAQNNAQTMQQQYDVLEQKLSVIEQLAGSLKHDWQAAQAKYDALYQQSLTIQAQQHTMAQWLATETQNDFWVALSAHDIPVLWRHIRVLPEWQHALGVVLAERLYARIVQHDFVLPDDLPQGAAAWTYPYDIDASMLPDVLPKQALWHHIEVDDFFQAALRHWLDGVLCAPDLAYALAQQNQLHGHQIWLTPEGHQVDRLSVMLYEPNHRNQIIKHQAQYEELTAQLQQLTPQLALVETELIDIKSKNQQHEQEYREIQLQQRTQAHALQAAHHQANQLSALINQGSVRCSQIDEEYMQLAKQLQQLTNDGDTLADEVARLARAMAQFDSDKQQQALQQQQQQMKQVRLALMENNRAYGLAQVGLYQQQQRLETIEQQLNILSIKNNELKERQSQLELIECDDAINDDYRIQFETMTEMVADLQQQMLDEKSVLLDTQEQVRVLYAQQQTLTANQPSLQETLQAAVLNKQECLINAKRFYQHLLDKQVDLSVLAQQAQSAMQPESISNHMVELNQKIQSLGAVNLAALAELAEAEEQNHYYRMQSDDVQAAIGLLKEAIAKIDAETKMRFKATFDLVNEKMQSLFPTLFGGGQANLQMVGDDLLTAGVAIMARPPGKKNSTIHLLSGGEKALTAMSLVFALFSLNPAPFCLLDEVDAPLDDANTGRFCDLVKQMSQQTQFLYISHNRLTMEMADQLIGVTMQEKGVSRIVAVDIQQALSMAEQ